MKFKIKISILWILIAAAFLSLCSEVAIAKSPEFSPIIIYDEDNLLELTLEDAGKYHGDICPCVVVAFRAIKLAISELWGNEIPRRDDFKIISSLPTDGSEDTFEFVTRVKRRKDFSYDLPEETNRLRTSAQNYSFVIIRKSNGRQIKIRVKEEIFQKINDNFFDLKTKRKLKKATAEEEKIFDMERLKLKEYFINLPVDKLFEVVEEE